jgi:hypothetical protein
MLNLPAFFSHALNGNGHGRRPRLRPDYALRTDSDFVSARSIPRQFYDHIHAREERFAPTTSRGERI